VGVVRVRYTVRYSGIQQIQQIQLSWELDAAGDDR